MKYIKLKVLLTCAIALLLTSCGGAINATIGGTVTGLSGNSNFVLQDNGGDNLTVSSNGTFTFATQIEAGSTYDVAVLTEPVIASGTLAGQSAGESCVVENGIGTVEQSIGNVDSITVVCNVNYSASNSIIFLVSGLPNGATVVLTNAGSTPVTITGTTAATVSYSFPPQAAGTS
ncbi:MAG TPA: hypothetical protein VK832_13830, partial [Burkholderiaceae bacterium]|nr:hypothetical protein [Burkholderiaceae bacterium]